MLQAFLDRLYGDLYDTAHDPEHGGLRLNALLRVLLDYLEEAGITADGQVAYFKQELSNLAAEVHGYAYDSDEDVLTLIYCIDANLESALGDPVTVQSTGKEEVDKGFRRLEGFVKVVRSGKIAAVDPSQPAHELIELTRESAKSGRTIVFDVITTGRVSEKAVASIAKDETGHDVWDITRLARTCGGTGDDKLSIDFAEEFSQTLPCLVTDKGADGIQVLFTCMPGSMLAHIYNTYRSRLLERNVRSFLQFTGKVNKGIRETLLSAPTRFLPYNNGLSATASKVDLSEVNGGLARIKAVHDFQIVNGGQTTASVAASARRDGADLANVGVAMKLTIVPRDRVDELVPLISKYANTQNRIQEADFSANHPWHIELERISRATWTQPSAEAPRGSRWFYERSRGQYADEIAAQNTAAGRRRFRAENPSAQKFTKTDLAKFVMTWDQRPAVVSRGAQKCFMEFMSQLVRDGRKPPTPDEFRRIVAQGILFHVAEHLYGDLGYQGYRAQVVTFAVARLSNSLQRRLPWEEIWEMQKLPDHLIQPLKVAIIGVREVITNPPPSRRNVTEWCKRDECWSAVLALSLELGLPELQGEGNPAEAAESIPQPTEEQKAVIDAVKAIPREVWMAVSKWGKETQSLQPWQRSLAYSVGNVVGGGRAPSPKQSVQGRRLLLKACSLGFTHAQLTQQLAAALKTAASDE